MCSICPSTPFIFRGYSACIYRASALLFPTRLAFKLTQFSSNFSTSTNRRKMASSAVAGESITVNGRQYRAVREGLALILAPYREKGTAGTKKSHNNDEGDQAVFYNPIQQYNRDLSVLAILTYGESAIVEKEAKIAKKGKKQKKGKKSSGAEGSLQRENLRGSENPKKRKADDFEEAAALANGGVKKPKTEEQNDEEDGGLEVQELDANDDVEIVTERINDQQAADESGGKADPPITAPSKKAIQFTILDALSASGLRAIRYAKEIPFATNIIANDLSAEAVKAIEFNIDHNELRGKVHSNVGDAQAYMYSKVGNELRHPPAGYVHQFDVIDLDPYGTAAPFFDSALLALADGGLLCVTCTDAGVFASNGYPEKAFSLYGGVTMKGPFSHEAGLRLIIHAVATSAAKYGIAVEPLLSLSIDFYARLFIRVHKQQSQVKVLAGTTMITYNCDFGCGAWKTQPIGRNQEKLDRVGETVFKHSYAQAPSAAPLCEHCGSKMHLAGPMWGGPIHNPYFVQRILDKLPDVDMTTYKTTERMRGMLTLALEEDLTLAASNIPSTSSDTETTIPPANARLIPRVPPQTIDATPFFFIPNTLAKILHCATPPENDLRGAIRHLGYKVTRSHCKAGSFKTNAPWDVLWEIMREWIRQRAPTKEGKVTKNMPGWKIMQKIKGSGTEYVADVQESIKRALEKGVDGKDELKALLESGLYRLDHPPSPESKEIETEDGNVIPDADKNGDGGLPKTAWNETRDVSKLKIVFDVELGMEKPRGKLVRYQINPRANWGPMNRAGGG